MLLPRQLVLRLRCHERVVVALGGRGGQRLRRGDGMLQGLVAVLLLAVVHGDVIPQRVLGRVLFVAVRAREDLRHGGVEVAHVRVEVGL